MTTPPWAYWFPMQTCAGCGDEHPGEGCRAQDDLFGGGSHWDNAPSGGRLYPIEAAPGPVLETPEVPRGLALDPTSPERTT